MATRLFESEDLAKLYSEFRPSYPKELYEFIHRYCTKKESSGLQLAVDVGCGNGQSTLPLTNYFKRVIGVDVSKQQIEQAKKKNNNVEFVVSPAEELGFLENDTVDLITIAQALHWLDRDKFFREVSRVLRPGGSFVAYGYGIFSLDNKDADKLTWEFYSKTLDGYWNTRAKDTENLYHNYTLPFDAWERNDKFTIQNKMTVDDVVGFMSSWSAWHTYLQSHPDSDALETLRARLKTIYTDGSIEHRLIASWPVFLLSGRKSSVV